MRPLNATELLRVWENNFNRSPIEQSLYLLATACSVKDVNEMAQLSIGERDSRLLQLHEWMFGSRFSNTTKCPKCSTLVEWENDIKDLRVSSPIKEIPADMNTFETDGFNIRFRLPNSYDMLLAASDNSYQQHPEQLIYNCILEAKHGEDLCEPQDIPVHIVDALDHFMAENDPQADVGLVVNCPACEHQWTAWFDIGTYLLAEINSWAIHMLQDVYLLAKNFGWSERDILEMSAQRRQLYLEMARS